MIFHCFSNLFDLGWKTSRPDVNCEWTTHISRRAYFLLLFKKLDSDTLWTKNFLLLLLLPPLRFLNYTYACLGNFNFTRNNHVRMDEFTNKKINCVLRLQNVAETIIKWKIIIKYKTRTEIYSILGLFSISTVSEMMHSSIVVYQRTRVCVSSSLIRPEIKTTRDV